MAEDDVQDIVDKIVFKLKKKKIKSMEFDHYVHQTASNEARKINESGLTNQIHFLISRGWTEGEIMDSLPKQGE